MRRKDRERDRAFAYDVIDRCEYGVAAMAGEGGAPYCVPLSLVRLGDTLYFHCALEGTKLDCLRRSPRAVQPGGPGQIHHLLSVRQCDRDRRRSDGGGGENLRPSGPVRKTHPRQYGRGQL